MDRKLWQKLGEICVGFVFVKIGFVAVMRKLIILLNQLLKNPQFQPT